jgi:gamma-glutamylcyclotransferase (GGCT)/AIG2-like uncharacterized protein YtfP
MSQINHLAVYGTLGPGKPNHHHVADIQGTWSRGAVRGFLHNSGWGAGLGFPGIVLDKDGPEVAVDILESPELDANLARLDDFEGPGYEQVAVEVETNSGLVAAWIYQLKN